MATVQNMQEINMIGDEMHRTENVAPSLSSSTTLNCAFFFFYFFFYFSPRGYNNSGQLNSSSSNQFQPQSKN